MPNFRYHALNYHRQSVFGELHAENVEAAIAQLEARGLVVQSIGFASPASADRGLDRMPTDENAARVTMEQTMLGAQLTRIRENAKSIAPALRAYSEEMPPGRRRHELESLVNAIETDDAAEAEKVFSALPDYWIPLLSAATTSLDPGRVLEEFLRETQQAEELKRQWWLTVSYPIVIACIAGAVMILLSVLVVPIFSSIFKDFNMILPAMTQVTINVSSLLAALVPVLFIIFLLAIVWLVYVLVRWPFRSSDFASRVPAFFLGRATTLARFNQFLADLLEAGLGVPDSLRVTGYLTSKKRLKKAAWQFADQLELGTSASHADPPRGTAIILQALSSEMPPHSRVRLLREISRAYAERASRRLSWTRGIIEPLSILAVGFVVAVMVTSLFLPLIKLIEGLSK
jgi:type II secretory pathway component PulF